MKKATISLTLMVYVSFCYAQKVKESEVPLSVKSTFAAMFPRAKGIEWSKESEGEFEAEFKTSGSEQSASFDTSGKWLETETEIHESQVPAALRAAIAKEFEGYKMHEVETLEMPSKPLLYELELKKDKVVYDVQFGADGKVIKKEEKESENKD